MELHNVVIYGTGGLSSLVWYCLTHDSAYRVVAFTVDEAEMQAPTHHRLPVVPFQSLAERYPPTRVRLMIPVGYDSINGVRLDLYRAAKAAGYGFVSYVSSRASTWPDLQVGENSLIHEHAVIQPFARVGDNVIIRSGARISHHCEVADHAYVADGVTLGSEVSIGERAFVGAGAVLGDGLKIAERSFIGAGAVVLADTEADGVYLGNPARQTGRCSVEATAGRPAGPEGR